jgi:hypothetical protein
MDIIETRMNALRSEAGRSYCCAASRRRLRDLTWIQPGISLTALALLFIWFIDGILAASSAISSRKFEEHCGCPARGTGDIGVGILTFEQRHGARVAVLHHDLGGGDGRTRDRPRDSRAQRSRVKKPHSRQHHLGRVRRICHGARALAHGPVGHDLRDPLILLVCWRSRRGLEAAGTRG